MHQTVGGGERVLIRRARPDDVALCRYFLADVSAEDLRLSNYANSAGSRYPSLRRQLCAPGWSLILNLPLTHER